ncbi:MAG: YegS/Rv2252/BmrU family lipid kinase [Erysipelotrichaceae bacterium]|nr:YegS/Rv2252/BmrU family lipid kinase [Erysipelotrichaceae bacterium]
MRNIALEVVAALIEKDGKYLICQRPSTKARGLMWEFVGGKIEEGEEKFQAIVRECREELGITLRPIEEVADIYHDYDDVSIHLTLIRCEIESGDIIRNEHVDEKWCTLEELDCCRLCPADRKLVRKMTGKNKVLFVYNPMAGQIQIKNQLWDIINTFSAADYDLTVVATQRSMDGYRVVSKKGAEYDMVVCSGGDGTLNEVINGLLTISMEKRPVLGYIPAGSTNDYASSLKLPKDMTKAAELIVSGTPHKFDMGMFNSRYFVYVAAFGAFTEVSYATDQSIKNMIGHLAYVLSGIKSLSNIKAYKVRVEADGVVREDEYIYGMASNSLYVGGLYDLSKEGVKLDDGLLEVMLVKNPKGLDQLGSIVSYLLGISSESDMIEVFKAEKVRFIPQEEVSWTLDGEYGGCPEQVEITVEKQSISIVVGEDYA